MANHQSAKKRIRQNARRRARNKHMLSKMKTLMKSVLTVTEKEGVEGKYKEAVSHLDKLATKKYIHPNNAARKKSQLTSHVNSLS